MDKATTRFLQYGNEGKAVFISDVRAGYAELPEGESFQLDIAVESVDGGVKTFPLRLPEFLGSGEKTQSFVEEYFLAELYNIVSSFGGRRVWLVNHDNAKEGAHLHAVCAARFGLSLARHERTGYGKAINVLERLNDALYPGDVSVFSIDIVPSLPAVKPYQSMTKMLSAERVFAEASADLAGKCILGIDIGGTDIKLALSMGETLVQCKEFDWYPTVFSTAEEFIQPIETLILLMAYVAMAEIGSENASTLSAILAPAFAREVDYKSIRCAVDGAAQSGFQPAALDAIGMCFPDMVVDNKIVGGESPKVRGIHQAFGADFDREYAKLTGMGGRLAHFVKPDGCVTIINDGSISAFTVGVETVVCQPEAVRAGVFAHSLGTDFGSGWVNREGLVPRIPLEIYNCIIDLGSWPERAYEPDDVRSINNFNTALPGTVQKYASQSGVFRLVLKYFPAERPALYRELFAKGFIVESDAAGRAGVYIPTSPVDMRKPFLEHIMALAESGDAVAERIFREIGEALAVVTGEINRILSPAASERMLFGRLVKKPECFALLQQGAAFRHCNALTVADDSIAETPLMKNLAASHEYTIAQFAQAIGALHYANSQLSSF